MNPQNWRTTFATFALIVYTMLALYWLTTIAIPWATGGLGEPWSFGTISV